MEGKRGWRRFQSFLRCYSGMCSPRETRAPEHISLGIYVSASTHCGICVSRTLVRACMRMKLHGTVVGHPVCVFLTVTLDKILKKQVEIFKTADERINLAQQKQKEQYKKWKGIVEYNFKIGNKVLRRNMLQKTQKGNKGEEFIWGI